MKIQMLEILDGPGEARHLKYKKLYRLLYRGS
jgi:hypothetical protein